MVAIIVGTHGNFAIELVKTCEMICGSINNIKAITLIPGESADDLVDKYETALKNLDKKDGVIFLNDLFGGSPYNAACRIAMQNETYGVVTGVNLAMLIEMVGCQLIGEKIEIQHLMQRAIDAGNSGIQTFHKTAIKENEEDDL